MSKIVFYERETELVTEDKDGEYTYSVVCKDSKNNKVPLCSGKDHAAMLSIKDFLGHYSYYRPNEALAEYLRSFILPEG